MTSLTETFAQKATPAWKAHPLYRHWNSQLEKPHIKSLSVAIYRPREGLTFAPAKIYVSELLTDGSKLPPGEYFWDSIANEGLIQLKARCETHDDEVMRFALMAQDAFCHIDNRVGDGYFNAVFLDQLRKAPFDTQPLLSKMLKNVTREYRAYQSSSVVSCAQEIDSVIGELAENLTSSERLGYDSDTADKVLDGALAQYIDERFNVTNRVLLGW